MFVFENVSTGNHEPPAYIVAFLLLTVLKFRDFGRSEKVWWHTFFSYREYVFMVRDYKFGSWSLESKKGTPVPDGVVKQVIAKIQSASRHADELLALELKKEIDAERFWIHNAYEGLKEAFGFYCLETQASIKSLQEVRDRHSAESLNVKDWSKRWTQLRKAEALVSYRAFPVLVSFFSLLDFLFDAFYAFERPQISFNDFRNLSWQERFKAVIPIPPGSEIVGIYEKLVRIKAQFRNPLTHGLTNETSLLAPVAFAGLVPVSYEHLESSVHFGHLTVSDTVAAEAMQAFGDALGFFSRAEPFAYYMLYLESGFSIPIELSEIDGLKVEMRTLEGFQAYLESKAAYQDAVANRDI
jgi:hypothetical protein